MVAGSWSYTLSEAIPLPSVKGVGRTCGATASGTADVSGSGSYSIAFPALSCSSCTMNASTVGTVSANAISGTVTASIAGGGCSVQQPTPNPAPVGGKCTSQTCTAQTPSNASYVLEYTLTPPR